MRENGTGTTLYLSERDSTVYGLEDPRLVEIVCGDCSERTDPAGNLELLPARTFLGADGRCYTCGGRSYVLASELCSALKRTITEKRKSELSQGPDNRFRLGESTHKPFRVNERRVSRSGRIC